MEAGEVWEDLCRGKLAHGKIAWNVLVDDYDRELLRYAFRSGANGTFLFSEQPFRLLCRCIRCVH